MEMTPARWEYTSAYLAEVFGAEDEHLAGLMARAVEAGLPDIAVSADVGRLLQLLTSMTGGAGGAKLAIELGTLAGYSAIWIARGLAPGGKLITVEPEAKHADFAAGEIARAGVADRVQVRRTTGLEALRVLAREFGAESVDLFFFDAIKTEYLKYYALAKPLLKRGGLLLADNVLGSNWWIDDPPGSSENRDAVDRFNRIVASDPDFVACAVPSRQGVMIARKK
ncbi:MAG TPA: O-methyltransferase [Phycisphaerales bacterium]|nr:O-methyltransferase [Phycisphaerales bacterium]